MCHRWCSWSTTNSIWCTNFGFILPWSGNWVPSSGSSTRPVTIEYITVSFLIPLHSIYSILVSIQYHHHSAFISGRNKYCLDKNFGSWLIIWDRMFGTFQEELSDEEVLYGCVDQVKSHNPLYLEVLAYNSTTQQQQQQQQRQHITTPLLCRFSTLDQSTKNGNRWTDGRIKSSRSSKDLAGHPEVHGPDTWIRFQK